MYPDWNYLRITDRITRELELAEQRRLVHQAARRGPSIRARIARRLFALAIATEKNETWRIVWERLGTEDSL